MKKPSGDSRERALFFSPEAPYPTMGGGALRSASILQYLARRYEVDAVFFRQPGEPDPADALPPRLVREWLTIALPPHSGSPVARALRNVSRAIRGVPPLVDRFAGFERECRGWLGSRRYSVAVVEHFWCAPYQAVVAPHTDRAVLNLHNVESLLHAGAAGVEGWPVSALMRRFQAVCRTMEERWLPRYGLLLTASEEDGTRVRPMAGKARVLAYPNAIPFHPQPEANPEEAVVFSGNLAYHPNQSAVRWFRERVWPPLRKSHPQLQWRIVGKNPDGVAPFVRQDPRIILTGPVPDAIAELARAKVAVAPLLTGSGTRIKILEMWAAGVPVVSTSLGAEGLSSRNGEHLLLADQAERFTATVSSLLDQPELRQRIGKNGRALYERSYTWERAWEGLEAAREF
jgi:polysaccharide biosynthesis protein PslH